MRKHILPTLLLSATAMLQISDCNGSPDIKPDNRITTEEIEEVLTDLWTDATRAYVVREYVEDGGFMGWVTATGGSPMNTPLGHNFPVSEERIVTTVNFYKDKGDYHIAGEIARDAAYSTFDEKYIDLAHETYLEGGRNTDLSFSARDRCYEEVAKYRRTSPEENMADAEEMITFYVELGDTTSANGVLRNLFPLNPTRNKEGELLQREMSESEREKREELQLYIENNQDIKFRQTRKFVWESHPYKRPDGEDNCNQLEWRAMQHNDYDFIFLLEKVREDPLGPCDPEQMLRSYEAIGWFEHARGFAATNGFWERVGTYDFIVEELGINNPKSKEHRRHITLLR